jgi:hypothetical protein
VSDIPSNQGPESENAAHEPPVGIAPLPAEHMRSRRKKMLTPLVLVIVGLALLVTAWLIYPSAAGYRGRGEF